MSGKTGKVGCGARWQLAVSSSLPIPFRRFTIRISTRIHANSATWQSTSSDTGRWSSLAEGAILSGLLVTASADCIWNKDRRH
jgi:hypothetical protein